MKTNLKRLIFIFACFFVLAIQSCKYSSNEQIEVDSIVIEDIEDDVAVVQNDTTLCKTEHYLPKSITLKEYVEDLRNDGLNMFHIEGDNVLIFTRWDNPVGGNANSQAEAIYRQAKSAHVYNIRTVRVVKMPEKKVVGRYVSRK